MKLKTFYGICVRSIPGAKRHQRQIEVMISATSRKAAHAALVAAGERGWSLYSFRQYWSEGADRSPAIDDPGVPFYRPEGALSAPWVRLGEPYPIEDIPDHMRETG